MSGKTGSLGDGAQNTNTNKNFWLGYKKLDSTTNCQNETCQGRVLFANDGSQVQNFYNLPVNFTGSGNCVKLQNNGILGNEICDEELPSICEYHCQGCKTENVPNVSFGKRICSGSDCSGLWIHK